MNIPKGHNAVMPYLILKDAAAFIAFTQSVFGAEVTHKGMREDSNDIMHAEIVVDGSTIMFAQATEKFGVANANLFVYVKDADATYQKALEDGAKSVMELSNQSYGKTCGVEDPNGNVWWITSI